MRSRDSLIRLHRFQVDEKRRQVVEIETMIAEFHRKEAELEQQILSEQERAGISDVGHYAYPTFAKAARDRRENLLKSIDGLAGQLEEAKESLAEAFAELKKYELLNEKELMRAKAEVAAREQAELDEVGLSMHRRGTAVV
jgi:flagellar export protein FliJ